MYADIPISTYRHTHIYIQTYRYRYTHIHVYRHIYIPTVPGSMLVSVCAIENTS